MFGMFYKYKNISHINIGDRRGMRDTCKTTEKDWQISLHICLDGSVRFGLIWFDSVWHGMEWYGMVWCGLTWCAMPALSVTTTAQQCVGYCNLWICASATNKQQQQQRRQQQWRRRLRTTTTQALSVYSGDIHRVWCTICCVRLSSLFVRHFFISIRFWPFRLILLSSFGITRQTEYNENNVIFLR